MGLDYSLSSTYSPPNIGYLDHGNLRIASNATFYDSYKVYPKVSQLPKPAYFNHWNNLGQMIEVYLSDYVFSTFFDAEMGCGGIDVSYILKRFLNVTLTTDNISHYIPEL